MNRPKRMSRRRPEREEQRRPLSQIGGTIETVGPSAHDRALAERSLDVQPDEQAARAHVHGFHSYPARVDPRTARRLIEELSPEGGTILDPFCGSGTVLVEGRLAGRRALGVDANPLAVELAWLKARGTTAEERASIVRAAHRVTDYAEDRRARRAGSSRRYGPEDTSLFDPHVLLELDSLKGAISNEIDSELRRVLFLVLSSILIKVSRRTGDSAKLLAPKRLASGFTIRLFLGKAEELARRLAAFSAMLPRGAPMPAVRLGDARLLEGVPDRSVQAIVTSPPYAGTYDYLEHHQARLRWLDIEATPFAETEIGARRHFQARPFREAIERWDDELLAALSAMRRVLAPSGAAALILGDSAAGARPILADESVRKLAPRAGLEVTAIASQERRHFHAPTTAAFSRAPRREHAIVLRAWRGR